MHSEGTATDHLATAFAFVEQNHDRRILTVTNFVQSSAHKRQLVIEDPGQLNQSDVNPLPPVLK